MIVTARNEAPGIAATLAALAEAFPAAPIVLGDDGSRDGTATLGRLHGAEVVDGGRSRDRGIRR